MSLPPFVSFPKIARLRRDVVVSEKIDGTNAIIAVLPDDRVLAGSRNGWLTDTTKDSFGFARWVKEHEDELRKGLGYGTHVGEWWGSGIQRRYGLKEKRFSLFNTKKWGDVRPACCHVVPTLYVGVFDTEAIAGVLDSLRRDGSRAAPGFMEPEGVIIYHVAADAYFKQTIAGDDKGKEWGA